MKVRLLTIALCCSTAACSSFQGRPSPVIGMNDVVEMARKFPQLQTVYAFHSSDAAVRLNMTPEQYRDTVISVYMAAIDARYYNFVTAISTQNKSSSLTLGTLALSLSSAATLTTQTAANILSAGAAVATGSQAKVNQTLYYERTLSAMVASMEASRNEVKARIIKRFGAPASDYSMEVAFTDLFELQNAASLDVAIERITSEAGKKSDEARVNLETVKDMAAGVDDSSMPILPQGLNYKWPKSDLSLDPSIILSRQSTLP